MAPNAQSHFGLGHGKPHTRGAGPCFNRAMSSQEGSFVCLQASDGRKWHCCSAQSSKELMYE